MLQVSLKMLCNQILPGTGWIISVGNRPVLTNKIAFDYPHQPAALPRGWGGGQYWLFLQNLDLNAVQERKYVRKKNVFCIFGS